jgi:hypothetical protein
MKNLYLRVKAFVHFESQLNIHMNNTCIENLKKFIKYLFY